MKTKIRRALAMTGYKKYPEEIIKAIPEGVIDRLSTVLLAKLIEANQAIYYAGQRREEDKISEFLGIPSDVHLYTYLNDNHPHPNYIIGYSDIPSRKNQ